MTVKPLAMRTDDEGPLNVKVSVDPSHGNILIDFGKPIHWIGLSRQEATAFALLILRHSADRYQTLDLPDEP